MVEIAATTVLIDVLTICTTAAVATALATVVIATETACATIVAERTASMVGTLLRDRATECATDFTNAGTVDRLTDTASSWMTKAGV